MQRGTLAACVQQLAHAPLPADLACAMEESDDDDFKGQRGALK